MAKKEKLKGAPKPNIIYSEKWDEGEWFTYFQQRLSDMRAKKKAYSDAFDAYEVQETAISFYDNQGSYQVQVPLEQNLQEIYMGRTNGKIVYDILPDGQADVEQLQPAKHALNFFLDGNDKNNFWKENKDFRNNKALYGTGIWFTGIRSYKDYRFTVKEDADIQSGTDLLNENNFIKEENETWFFFPKSIHPKDFYPDDAAYGQTDIQNANDCIFKEKLSYMEFKMRYGNNKAFINIDKILPGTDEDPKNRNDNSVEDNEIVLHHLFDRITKTYMIVSDEAYTIYRGIYLYDDGKIPFVMSQHYTNTNCIWGRGIPQRIGYLKVYKSEILQDILVGAEIGSGIHLLTGNDDQIGQDWEVGGRGVNLWRSTGGAEQTQRIDIQPNLGYFTSVLEIIDDLVVQDTGDNPRSPSQAQSDKVGIVEIMEANKAVRQSSIDENYNIGLDDALTMTLSRIKQFAPSLLLETIKDSDGKIIKTIFPKIKIDGYEVKKEDGKMIIEENIGKFGYFELKPDVIQGVGVKVVTSSTNSMLPILERQKVTEYINNLTILANAAALDQTGETLQKLKESINFDDLMEWNNDAYGYDNKLKANTDKDKIEQKNKKSILELKEKLTLENNPIPDENIGNIPEGQEVGQTPGTLPDTANQVGGAGGLPTKL